MSTPKLSPRMREALEYWGHPVALATQFGSEPKTATDVALMDRGLLARGSVPALTAAGRDELKRIARQDEILVGDRVRKLTWRTPGTVQRIRGHFTQVCWTNGTESWVDSTVLFKLDEPLDRTASREQARRIATITMTQAELTLACQALTLWQRALTPDDPNNQGDLAALWAKLAKARQECV